MDYDAIVKRTTILLPDEVRDRPEHVSLEARVSGRERRTGSQRRVPRIDPLATVEGIVRDGELSQSTDEALYSGN